MEIKNINKTLRFCKKCEKDLPKTLEYFPYRKTEKSGFGLYCKECLNKEKRERRAEKRKIWNKGGKIDGEGRKCTICKIIYPETQDFFGKHQLNSIGLDTYCKICRRERGRLNYSKNREKWNLTHNKNFQIKKNKIIDYKENSNGCLKCGEKRYFLLDFHHKDHSTKLFQISQGKGYGWKKIEEEIKKCVILCSNCHRDFHYQEKINKISISEYLAK